MGPSDHLILPYAAPDAQRNDLDVPPL
jgi:hypothetical protein